MPNHTDTILTVNGPDAKVQEFINKHIKEEECKNYDGEVIVDAETGKPQMKRFFDFETIIPMPKSMHITSGSTTSQAIALIKAEAGDMSGVDDMVDYTWVKEKCEGESFEDRQAFVLNYLQEEVTPEARKEGQMALDNIEKYGVQDWYSWSINNWGTKWNSYDFREIERSKGHYKFGYQTAWSPAMPIISKLGELYPELTFINYYIDEGWGYYGSHIVQGKTDTDEEMDGYCQGADFMEFANEKFGYDFRLCDGCGAVHDPDCSEGDGTLCYSCQEAKENNEEKEEVDE